MEIEADGKSVLIELGLPLDADKPDASLLPQIPGLTDGSNPDLVGVVVSHTHADHVGLAEFAHPAVPVLIGVRAKVMLDAVRPFMPKARPLPTLIKYVDRQPFGLGPFQITPFLTDHSAFDAYSLLIEADGKRVFYSGDIRAHGRKAILVERLMQRPPVSIDVLLLEGTALSRRLDGADDPQTEQSLEDEIARHMAQAEGLVLSAFSPQNIDRFVTMFKAARQAGRTFVGDLYLAHLIRCLDLPSLPRAGRTGFRVYLPVAQRRRILADKSFDLVEPFRRARIFREEIAADPSRWVMLFRESMAKELEPVVARSPTTVIYSQWPGYLDRPTSRLRAWCAAHTSGHADKQTLVRFAAALSPRRIVPIHTTVPHMFEQLFVNATVSEDTKWLSV